MICLHWGYMYQKMHLHRFVCVGLLIFSVITGSVCVPNVVYNSVLPEETWRYLFGVSLGRCNEECLARPGCKSFNYLTKLHLCGLNKVDSTGSPLAPLPGCIYVSRASLDQTSASGQCDPKCSNTEACQQSEGGGRKCVVAECSPPPEVGPAVKILGNRRHIGARVVYTCPQGLNLDRDFNHNLVTSTCLHSGIWSTVNFTCKSCPDGWSGYGYSCYMFGSAGSIFTSAKNYCTALGSHLVYVETVAEDTFLKTKLLASNIVYNCAFMGINYEDASDRFVFDGTSTAISYHPWYPGEPTGNEGCVGYYTLLQFEWVDLPCSFHCIPICEKDATKTSFLSNTPTA